MPTCHAFFWNAGVTIVNECSETIRVNIEGSSYTLGPGEEASKSLCDNFCTGALGTCRSHDYSFSAFVVDPSYDYSWSGSGSDEACFFDTAYDRRTLTCNDLEPEPEPDEDYDYSCDYGDYDCEAEPEPDEDYDYSCDYGDYDCGADRSPAPNPPSPVPRPAPIPVPLLPPPSPIPSPPPSPIPSPPPSPIPIDPVDPSPPPTVESPKPDSFAQITFNVAGATSDTFDRSGFTTLLSDVTEIPYDWIEVSVSEVVAQRRKLQRRRHLLRSLFQETVPSGLLVDSKMYTEKVQETLDRVRSAVQTGEAQQKLAATNNKISSITVDSASSSSSSSSNVGAIVGGVIGGIAAVAMVAGGFMVWHTRRQKKNKSVAGPPVEAPVPLQQQNPNDFVVLNPPLTMPSQNSISVSSTSRMPSQRSSGLRGLINPSAVPPTLPPVDPLMSWVSQQLASNPPAIRSNALSGPYEVQFSQLQVERPIGEGSFGRVYAGKLNNAAVAIKVLLEASSGRLEDPLLANNALTASSPIMVKLHEEVKIMSAMDSPYVVKFIGVCSMPPCIVTELCAQGSLSDVIKKAALNPAAASQLSWRRRLAMAIDAAEGMRYLHSQTPPIIHRDLKSANMLVTDDFKVKISDFNLSKILDDSTKSSSLAAMNPRWLAPELFDGARGSRPCDVFAFGVVLWELLTLDIPWGTTNPWQIVSSVREGARLPIPERHQLQGAAPMTAACYAGFVRLVTKCWAQVPEDRPEIGRVSEELRILAAGDV